MAIPKKKSAPGSMRALFRQEATKAIGAMTESLNVDSPSAWDLDALLAGCRRIRNGARISGSGVIDELTSEIEAVLLRVQGAEISPDETLARTLGKALNAISELVHETRREADPSLLDALARRLKTDAAVTAPGSRRPTPAPSPTPSPAGAAAQTSQPSMQALLRQEVQAQSEVMTRHLLAVEASRATARDLEALMRAAHSIKGAARITGVTELMALAHAMEDLFVAAQRRDPPLDPTAVDLLLRAVDGLVAASTQPDSADLRELTDQVLALLPGDDETHPAKPPAPTTEPQPRDRTASATTVAAAQSIPDAPEPQPDGAASINIDPQSLDQMLGLSGELGVATGRLNALRGELLRTYRQGRTLSHDLKVLLRRLRTTDPALLTLAQGLPQRAAALTDRQSRIMGALEDYEYTTGELARRLHTCVVAQRMCPFGGSATAFHRLVRDLCRALGKQAALTIRGESTQVDRDILDRLRIPLTHLLQNAVDHGLEDPPERNAAGKPARGELLLQARHRAGRLIVVVSDDGRGIDREQLRRRVVERGLATEEMLRSMTDAELFDFLLLPGFTLKGDVSTVSGRGVGLDLVRGMLQSVHGSIRISSPTGRGTRFELQLPLTLSLIRCLLVEIGGEVYALPVARLERVLRLAHEQIRTLGGTDYVDVDGQPVGLVDAARLLDINHPGSGDGQLNLILLGGTSAPGEAEEGATADGADAPAPRPMRSDGAKMLYGLVVERLLGETELVERPLDPRLGKVRDISAAAIIDDGRLALILDLDDLARDIDRHAAAADLGHVERQTQADRVKPRKRVLVVDDSITVREIERGLLATKGYEVEVAVDGIDGWNAVRLGGFDLVVTDVDMPRMDGITLVEHIRSDPRLSNLPVMIVSYKDRDADRRRGLEAGADCYLTKGGFRDDDLTQAVDRLIGAAQ